MPLLTVVLLLISLTKTSHAGWGYIDQDGWSKLHDSSCGGKKQSPIDLPDVCDKDSATVVNPRMNLDLINYDSLVPASVMTLKNNGHTAVIRFRDSKTPNAWAPKVSGSVVYGQSFQLLSMHFHWDKRAKHIGSEHALHGDRLAFEMHLVHFNTKYATPSNASNYPDGFAVLGTLFQSTEDDDQNNAELDKIVSQLRHVSAFNASSEMKRSLNLRRLLPSDIDTFYTYAGSLTTPPCSEIITWIIFSQVQQIGPNQLFAFERSLDSDSKQVLDHTCRDLQPLNQRIVFSSSDNHCRGQAARPSTALLSLNGQASLGSGNSGNSGDSQAVSEPMPQQRPQGNQDTDTGYDDRPPRRQRPQRPQRRPQKPVIEYEYEDEDEAEDDDDVEVIMTDDSYDHRRPALVNGLVGGLLG